MLTLRAVVVLILPTLAWSVKCTDPPSTTPMPSDPPPVYWPRGRYTIVKAGKSCPTDPKNGAFKEGFRYQDSEDNQNGNDWVEDSPGMGEYMKSDGYQFNFCSKTKDKKVDGMLPWPKGNYCIHPKTKICPWKNLWTPGNITFDDENTNNRNARKGLLPYGTPGSDEQDTVLTFCCRDDGDVTAPMLLPIDTPFYLWKYNGDSCQQVAYMDVAEEPVLWDEEDSGNISSSEGATPANTGRSTDRRLTLCLYTKKASSTPSA